MPYVLSSHAVTRIDERDLSADHLAAALAGRAFRQRNGNVSLGEMARMEYNRGTTSIDDRSGAGNTLRSDTERDKLSMQPHHTPAAPILKVCTKCGEAKPATPEFFSRDRKKRDGLFASCKECDRAYRAANKERIAARARAYYIANKERINERNRAWSNTNKEKESERHRVWYAANKERHAQYGRAYFQANIERRREYQRAYRAANRERMLEYQRSYVAAKGEQWTEARRAYREARRGDPSVRAQYRVRSQRRRTLKRQASGTHTVADVQAQYERQKGKCYWCGVKVGDNYHVDHIHPLSRGGSNGPENLVIACPHCNESKGAKLPHEWPQGGRLI